MASINLARIPQLRFGHRCHFDHECFLSDSVCLNFDFEPCVSNRDIDCQCISRRQKRDVAERFKDFPDNEK
uniref:Uncharacterized protein n=1 Tax=Acrobeloides nanus TaxID=290746 RepID=A0A914CPS7_9BILA